MTYLLPEVIDIKHSIKVKKLRNEFIKESNGVSEQILNKLSFIRFKNIESIKNEVKVERFDYWLDKLEEKNIVQVERKTSQKTKTKIVNFVIIKKTKALPKLTKKQAKVYDDIKSNGDEFPLAKIAKKYSYSIVKTLRNKGILELEPREVKESLLKKIPVTKKRKQKIILTGEQVEAISTINENQEKGQKQIFLLYGVTGSGKTEVYMRAIKKTLSLGKTAIFLVPEISLTPQMVATFYANFDDKIAIWHSHLNKQEKYQQWQNIKNKKSKIVIGARSAIFTPLENIGLIIVDEEHESSYKQEKQPRYNARDLAIVRAQKNNATVILGSATPSLESFYNIKRQNYKLLTLKERPGISQLPEVEIIDMRQTKYQKKYFSDILVNKIEKRLQNDEQIILFQNRRGHSSFVQCVNCGKLFDCSDCEISMNYHSFTQELKCHYCGQKKKLPRKCPDCGSYVFNFGSPGTQQIEKQLNILFPQARILRMDSDTTTKKSSYDSMFKRMENGRIDILLGTQMISKGLDFPNVTLVGVISADTSLNFPDFRASEKTFQLLTQVAGRSGRGGKKGEVVIQTYNPDHYAINKAMEQDFIRFSDIELKLRKSLNYPPYTKIARMIFTYNNNRVLKTQLDNNKHVFSKLKTIFSKDKLQILGPVQAPLPKIKGKYRFHIIIKSHNVTTLSKVINFLKINIQLKSYIKQTIDIDPLSLV